MFVGLSSYFISRTAQQMSMKSGMGVGNEGEVYIQNLTSEFDFGTHLSTTLCSERDAIH
jgi:hypothetical protein